MENIRFGKIEENKYYIISDVAAQALATIILQNNEYFLNFNFQLKCNRESFEKWYLKFIDYISNEYKEAENFIIFKNDLKPGMSLYLQEIGINRVGDYYFQPNTLEKQVAIEK